MGRWVTSKGRRIYIPDENEEGELADKYRQRVKEVKAEIEKHPSKGLPGATEHYDYKHHYEDSDNVRYSKSKSINKDLDTKEKQIAENKKQVDSLNGKSSKSSLEKANSQAKINAENSRVLNKLYEKRQKFSKAGDGRFIVDFEQFGGTMQAFKALAKAEGFEVLDSDADSVTLRRKKK